MQQQKDLRVPQSKYDQQVLLHSRGSYELAAERELHTYRKDIRALNRQLGSSLTSAEYLELSNKIKAPESRMVHNKNEELVNFIIIDEQAEMLRKNAILKEKQDIISDYIKAKKEKNKSEMQICEVRFNNLCIAEAKVNNNIKHLKETYQTVAIMTE